jgi:hypothetical protein
MGIFGVPRYSVATPLDKDVSGERRVHLGIAALDASTKKSRHNAIAVLDALPKTSRHNTAKIW